MAFAVDNNNDGFDAPDDFQMSTKIMVFGVGGAGGNAVENMVVSGVNDVDYIVANTDVAALRLKDGALMKRIQLGRKTAGGRGAGNNPAKGKASAEESKDDIIECLDGVAMLFITAGMGGGTGTGAAPVVAAAARDKGILTVGVVTKPFKFEGTAKMNQALAGIAEMKKYVDALIVIPNERLSQMRGMKLTIQGAFAAVDSILCKTVSGIIDLIQNNGTVNVDFADLCMALKDSGIAHIAIGNGKGDNMLEDAIDEVLHSPLLETSIEGARRGLINLKVSPEFPLDAYGDFMDGLTAKFNANAEYKCGFTLDPELAADEISIIAVATDFVDEEEAPPMEEEPQPMPAVTIAPASDGVSGNIGFKSEEEDVEKLLRMFQQSKDWNG